MAVATPDCQQVAVESLPVALGWRWDLYRTASVVAFSLLFAAALTGVPWMSQSRNGSDDSRLTIRNVINVQICVLAAARIFIFAVDPHGVYGRLDPSVSVVLNDLQTGALPCAYTLLALVWYRTYIALRATERTAGVNSVSAKQLQRVRAMTVVGAALGWLGVIVTDALIGAGVEVIALQRLCMGFMLAWTLGLTFACGCIWRALHKLEVLSATKHALLSKLQKYVIKQLVLGVALAGLYAFELSQTNVTPTQWLWIQVITRFCEIFFAALLVINQPNGTVSRRVHSEATKANAQTRIHRRGSVKSDSVVPRHSQIINRKLSMQSLEAWMTGRDREPDSDSIQCRRGVLTPRGNTPPTTNINREGRSRICSPNAGHGSPASGLSAIDNEIGERRADLLSPTETDTASGSVVGSFGADGVRQLSPVVSMTAPLDARNSASATGNILRSGIGIHPLDLLSQPLAYQSLSAEGERDVMLVQSVNDEDEDVDGDGDANWYKENSVSRYDPTAHRRPSRVSVGALNSLQNDVNMEV